MILIGPGRFALLAGMVLMSAPARADVMEINADGVRWISGALSAVPAMDPESGDFASADLSGPSRSGVTQLGAEYAVPNRIIADPAQHTANIPPQYAAKVQELAARFDLSPTLIEALVWQESRWRPDARSPVGARGLAQLMPGTARELGVNPDDPFANLEGGARYLRQQLDRFDGDLEKALAAYNAGPGRVERANGVPRIRETQNYVVSIIGRLSNHSRSTE